MFWPSLATSKRNRVEIYNRNFLLNFQFLCRDRKEIEETLRDMVAAMIEELIEPSKHGIEAKAD